MTIGVLRQLWMTQTVLLVLNAPFCVETIVGIKKEFASCMLMLCFLAPILVITHNSLT